MPTEIPREKKTIIKLIIAKILSFDVLLILLFPILFRYNIVPIT